ncbi:MAG TPA: flagellar hook basal-body protein [Phycisphaerales bacterium]|nr:flagellar hook basal-body protein [Phycisphaerales bacterium]
MSYGLNISASGLMTSIYAQEVWANNLANMDTPGFKPDIPVPAVRQDVRREDGVGYLPSNTLLERLGGGTLMHRNRVDFSQGAIKSGGPLDLAIEGSGFFVVRDTEDRKGDMVRLTRDGRFTRAADGSLVTATGGMPVLDVNKRPVRLPPGSVQVGSDGTVTQGGRVVARIKVIDVPSLDLLQKADKSQFVADANALSSQRPARGIVKQHAYEDSAADEVQALMRMSSAARDVEWNAGMIQAHDRIMERAIGMGRLA